MFTNRAVGVHPARQISTVHCETVCSSGTQLAIEKSGDTSSQNVEEFYADRLGLRNLQAELRLWVKRVRVSL